MYVCSWPTFFIFPNSFSGFRIISQVTAYIRIIGFLFSRHNRCLMSLHSSCHRASRIASSWQMTQFLRDQAASCLVLEGWVFLCLLYSCGRLKRKLLLELERNLMSFKVWYKFHHSKCREKFCEKLLHYQEKDEC